MRPARSGSCSARWRPAIWSPARPPRCGCSPSGRPGCRRSTSKRRCGRASNASPPPIGGRIHLVVLIADHSLRFADVVAPDVDEVAARRALRAQIARFERQLADALVTTFPHGSVDVSVPARHGPRLLDLGALEALRDDLAERLRAARSVLAEQAARRREAQELLEAMYADPARHRFVRLPRSELGVPGCGAYEVRPRLGLVGMLMGWWQVKLSSGCPR